MNRHFIENKNSKYSLCKVFDKEYTDTFVTGEQIWNRATTTNPSEVTCGSCKRMKVFKVVNEVRQ